LPKAADKMRYEGHLTAEKIEKLSRKHAFFVPDDYYVYPRLPIKIKGNFNPVFSYEILESFLEIFGPFSGIKLKIKQFMAKTKKSKIDVLGPMGFETVEWYSKKKISAKDEEIFFNTAEIFCNDEIKSGRPYLGFLVGLYAWQANEKNASKLSMRLLNNVPDDICHPIIKAVVRAHYETRHSPYHPETAYDLLYNNGDIL